MDRNVDRHCGLWKPQLLREIQNVVPKTAAEVSARIHAGNLLARDLLEPRSRYCDTRYLRMNVNDIHRELSKGNVPVYNMDLMNPFLRELS